MSEQEQAQEPAQEQDPRVVELVAGMVKMGVALGLAEKLAHQTAQAEADAAELARRNSVLDDVRLAILGALRDLPLHDEGPFVFTLRVSADGDIDSEIRDDKSRSVSTTAAGTLRPLVVDGHEYRSARAAAEALPLVEPWSGDRSRGYHGDRSRVISKIKAAGYSVEE